MDSPPRKILQLLKRKLKRRPKAVAFSDEHPCVFVLSTGRVGSMTLAALLANNSNMVAHHEPRPSLFSMSRAYYQFGDKIPDDFWPYLWQVLREDLLNAALLEGRGYVETSPQGTFLAPVIATMVPQVRFIHLVRNPFDVVRSGVSRQWYNGHFADRNRIEPRPNDSHESRWATMTVIEKNLWLWYETNRWIIEQLKDFPNHRHIRVHAEDMFRGDPKTIEQISVFCGAESFRSMEVKSILRRPLNKQVSLVNFSYNTWHSREKDFAMKLLPRLLDVLGYSNLLDTKNSK
jgi:hypothetical protein